MKEKKMIATLLSNKYYKEYEVLEGTDKYVWFVKPEYTVTNKDIVLTRNQLVEYAMKEIKEWWQMFEEDENDSTDDNLGREIENFLLEDGFPKEIIELSMDLYSSTH